MVVAVVVALSIVMTGCSTSAERAQPTSEELAPQGTATPPVPTAPPAPTPTVADGSEFAADPTSLVGVVGPVLRHVGPYQEAGSLDALVAGPLEFEDGCLYVRRHPEPGRFPVVWPAGTAWDDVSGRVVLPSGAALRSSQVVHGGGGYFKIDQLPRSASTPEVVDLATRCLDEPDGEVAVANNTTHAIDAAPPGQEPMVSGVVVEWLPEAYTWSGHQETMGVEGYVYASGRSEIAVVRWFGSVDRPGAGASARQVDAFTVVEYSSEVRVWQDVSGDVRIEVVGRNVDTDVVLRVMEGLEYVSAYDDRS